MENDRWLYEKKKMKTFLKKYLPRAKASLLPPMRGNKDALCGGPEAGTGTPAEHHIKRRR